MPSLKFVEAGRRLGLPPFHENTGTKGKLVTQLGPTYVLPIRSRRLHDPGRIEGMEWAVCATPLSLALEPGMAWVLNNVATFFKLPCAACGP